MLGSVSNTTAQLFPAALTTAKALVEEGDGVKAWTTELSLGQAISWGIAKQAFIYFDIGVGGFFHFNVAWHVACQCPRVCSNLARRNKLWCIDISCVPQLGSCCNSGQQTSGVGTDKESRSSCLAEAHIE